MDNEIVVLLRRGSTIHDPKKKVNGKVVSKIKQWDSVGDEPDYYLSDGVYGGCYSYFEFGVVWDDNIAKMFTYDEADMEDFLVVSRGKIIENKIH
jgi:hypothetical protein